MRLVPVPGALGSSSASENEKGLDIERFLNACLEPDVPVPKGKSPI
jgi:hypothetical protein